AQCRQQDALPLRIEGYTHRPAYLRQLSWELHQFRSACWSVNLEHVLVLGAVVEAVAAIPHNPRRGQEPPAILRAAQGVVLEKDPSISGSASFVEGEPEIQARQLRRRRGLRVIAVQPFVVL